MNAGEVLVNVFFYIFALVAVGGALAVALSRNIVRSAFALLAVLFSAAAMYAFMRADFVFAAQIIIYVGGILVLIIFAIMLTHRITDVKVSNESAPGPAAIFASFCVLFSIGVVVLTHRWDRSVRPAEVTLPNTTARAQMMMTQADGHYGPDRGTGIVRGGMMQDGRGFLVVRVPEPPPGTAAARFTILRAKRQPDKPVEWRPHLFQGKDRKEDHRDVAVEMRPNIGAEARLEVSDLPAGEYRWTVALVPESPEGQVTPPVAMSGDGADFTVENGLTRPLGRALMGPYLLPFEVVSVLLLAALIGASFLARKEIRIGGRVVTASEGDRGA